MRAPPRCRIWMGHMESAAQPRQRGTCRGRRGTGAEAAPASGLGGAGGRGASSPAGSAGGSTPALCSHARATAMPAAGGDPLAAAGLPVLRRRRMPLSCRYELSPGATALRQTPAPASSMPC